MSSKFKVIVVGGGVAGLTLASALEKAHIDYILLESRNEVAPKVGASIAIGSNGGRIVDQLGCWEELENANLSLKYVHQWYNGKLFNSTNSLTLTEKRTGYPLIFMDRHILLETLNGSIADKSKILVNKRVSRVDHSEDGVSVQCKDGTTYNGDIVVGTDGVHSIVRNEMWRHMSVAEPGILKADERNSMSSEYSCMYGISKPVEGFESPEVFNAVFGKDMSFLHCTAKDGRIWWFIFSKLDKKYNTPDIPKYGETDDNEVIQRALDSHMNETVTFREFWDKRLSYKLVPMEEAWFKDWTWGRFVCVGDSIHKWTPNIGQGGNNAIESAGALANALHELLNNKSVPHPPAHADIAKALKGYQDHRKVRTKAAFKASIGATRIEAMANPIYSFLGHYVLPAVGEWAPNQVANLMIGAERLDYLPEPERVFTGTMTYNPNYGVGKEPSKLRRALKALPFLPAMYFFAVCFGTILERPAFQAQAAQFLSSHTIDYGTGQTWYIPNLPEPLPLLLAAFSGGLLDIDLAQRWQSLTFLVDVSPLYLIFIFEAFRRANVMKWCYFPIIWGLAAQLKGLGMIVPLYFFLHYVQNPIDDFMVSDWRLVNTAAAKSALVAILVGFTIPTWLAYTIPDLQTRLNFNAFWQVWPVTVAVLHYALRKTAVTDTTQSDKLYNVKADLPFIRFGIRTLAIISAVTFNYVRYIAKPSLYSILIPDFQNVLSLHSANPADLDIPQGVALFLQLDWVSTFVCAFAWLALLIKDMKDVELTNVSWFKVVAVAALGTFVAGPGTVVALAWLWREETLATKHAKGAILRPQGIGSVQNGKV